MTEPLCARCRGPASIADHEPAHSGDWNKFRLGPLQSLCADCHAAKHGNWKPRGYDDAIGNDGLPIDPKHPFNRPGGHGRIDRWS
jgi:hypothetical protein